MLPRPFFEEGREYLVLVHRRRALVVVCVAAAFLVAAFHNSTARPLFEATTQLFIDHEPVHVLPSAMATESEPGGAEYYETQYELLRGRELVDTVLARLGTDASAELAAGPLVSPWERVRRLLRPPAAAAAGPMGAGAAAAAFRSRVTIEPLSGSRLVNVRFRAYDAAFAARAVNALAEVYIAQALDQSLARSETASRWLGQRLKEQQARLQEGERALLAFRESEGIVDAEPGRGLAERQLAAVNEAFVAAHTERLGKEALVARARDLKAEALETFPPVAENRTIQAMKARAAELRDEHRKLQETLGDRHPEILALEVRIATLEADIQTEARSIVKAIENAHDTAVEQEDRLALELQAAKKEALARDRTALRAATLEREVESRRALLRELTARAQQAGLEAQLRFTSLRIVEKADVPGVPILPRRAFNYQLALLLGLNLGVGLAVLIGRIDDTVKTPDDVTELLGLPFLGMLPAVAADHDDEVETLPAAAREPQSAVAEAYRVIRTNLIFSAAADGGRVVLLTSASPGEGKTTTAVNLAISLAQNGARVLAVDADLRRPSLHARFGLAAEAGLADVLAGEASLASAIRTTSVPGLRLLCAGTVPPNPAELLGSAALRTLLDDQRGRYDWLLIDAPPVLAMADAPLLSTLADGLLMVVWSEHCGRPSLKRALDQIRAVGGRLTGVVLNKVDLKRNAYYYGQHYGEYYRRYYAETEAIAAAAR